MRPMMMLALTLAAAQCAPSLSSHAALEAQFHGCVYVSLSGEAIIEIWRADAGTFTVLATTAAIILHHRRR